MFTALHGFDLQSSVLEEDELRQEHYYPGTFLSPGLFQGLCSTLHGGSCKMPVEKVRICHQRYGSMDVS